MNITSLIDWMVRSKLADNRISAEHIANGLHLYEEGNAEQMLAVLAYRKWRPVKTQRHGMKCLQPYQVYDMVLAGLTPDDVVERELIEGDKARAVQIADGTAI